MYLSLHLSPHKLFLFRIFFAQWTRFRHPVPCLIPSLFPKSNFSSLLPFLFVFPPEASSSSVALKARLSDGLEREMRAGVQ